VLALLRGHHPADDVAAEQVDDHVGVYAERQLHRPMDDNYIAPS
jgi:hypothetical protein